MVCQECSGTGSASDGQWCVACNGSGSVAEHKSITQLGLELGEVCDQHVAASKMPAGFVLLVFGVEPNAVGDSLHVATNIDAADEHSHGFLFWLLQRAAAELGRRRGALVNSAERAACSRCGKPAPVVFNGRGGRESHCEHCGTWTVL